MDKSPDAFRTISEVADELNLPQHVLRFWETRFPQIKPMKRGGAAVITALMISISSRAFVIFFMTTATPSKVCRNF